MVDKLLDLAVQALGRLAQNAERDRDRALGGRALLRGYYLEVTANLALLDCLDKDALKKYGRDGENQPQSADSWLPAVAAIAERLETRIAAAILTDENAARPGGLYEVLQNAVPPAGAAADGAEPRQGFVYSHILESVAYSVRQIGLLRKLSTLTPEESALLHGINLALRVEHLQKRLSEVVKTLHSLGGITGLSALD